MALLAAGLVLLLPDTVNRPLPEVIEDVQAWTLRVQKEEKSDFQSKMKERRNSSKQDILEGINVNELKKLDLKYLVIPPSFLKILLFYAKYFFTIIESTKKQRHKSIRCKTRIRTQYK